MIIIICSYIEKYYEKLTLGKETVKIFFPLCGKALDMKWLYDNGHEVVGVEISELAIKQFFEESNLQYAEDDATNVKGKVFKSIDGRLSLYACDIFHFNKSIECQFDTIWDRASFTAINKKDRERYADLMMSLMKPESCMMLVTLKYDPQLFSGPPHFVPDEQIHSLYGTWYNIEKLEITDVTTDKWRSRGIDPLIDQLDLITPKI